MSSKKITDLNKLKKPTRGRPKNKFVSYKNLWCLPYGMMCDEARNQQGRCREEAPKHTMPFPFSDFDCQHYVKIPPACMQLQAAQLKQLMTLAIEGAFASLFGLVNCCLTMQSVECFTENQYRTVFIVEYQATQETRENKTISLLIDLEKDTVTPECEK